MRILIVDDEPQRHDLFMKRLGTVHDLVIVNNYASAVHQLEGAPFDLVHLDYDLDEFVQNPVDAGPYGKEKTGFDVARYMAGMVKSKWPKKVVVHSLNPAKAPLMLETLRGIGIPVEYKPFSY